MLCANRGGFRGGGGGGDAPPPQGFDPLPTQRVPPLILFQKSIFGRPTLKFFLRRLRRQYMLFLRGSARQKNAFFLSKFFKKCPKTAFLTVFSKICLRRRKFSQNRGKTVLWESAKNKNQFGRPKKKKRSSKFWKFFWKSAPPPRENPRSAPVCEYPLMEELLS